LNFSNESLYRTEVCKSVIDTGVTSKGGSIVTQSLAELGNNLKLSSGFVTLGFCVTIALVFTGMSKL